MWQNNKKCGIVPSQSRELYPGTTLKGFSTFKKFIVEVKIRGNKHLYLRKLCKATTPDFEKQIGSGKNITQ
jgi:hypothetical protein